MRTILSQLQSLPIFRLSLGSKELFHSNFLEFLWDIDKNNRVLFIKIINKLLPDAQKLKEDSDYSNHELGREKENFDICLFHYEIHKTKNNKGQKHIVYDLIIENKVKSIPLIQQLKEYEVKVKNNKWNSKCSTSYLLLSLVDDFADKQSIQDDGNWAIANYEDLKTAIAAEKSNWTGEVGDIYIEDYCTFIGLMHQLQKAILQNFEQTLLFQDVAEFKEYRLHDLYIKLRCCKFLMLLKDKLTQRGMSPGVVSFIKNYKDIRNNSTSPTPGVYLNYNIFNGEGQAAAWIYTDNTANGDIHEIVLQGNQYRHGINSLRYKLEGVDKIRSQQNIWDELHKDSFDANFLDSPKKPDKPIKGRKTPFNGYDSDYIYRHDDIVDKVPVSQLLDMMADDVVKVYKHFNKNCSINIV